MEVLNCRDVKITFTITMHHSQNMTRLIVCGSLLP